MAATSLVLIVVRARRAFGGVFSTLLKLWHHGFFILSWLDGFPIPVGLLWWWWTLVLCQVAASSWPRDLCCSPLLGRCQEALVCSHLVLLLSFSRWGFGGSISVPHVTWQYGSNRVPFRLEVTTLRSISSPVCLDLGIYRCFMAITK
eukprot:Gb_05204 [translate_table: standard]